MPPKRLPSTLPRVKTGSPKRGRQPSPSAKKDDKAKQRKEGTVSPPPSGSGTSPTVQVPPAGATGVESLAKPPVSQIIRESSNEDTFNMEQSGSESDQPTSSRAHSKTPDEQGEPLITFLIMPSELEAELSADAPEDTGHQPPPVTRPVPPLKVELQPLLSKYDVIAHLLDGPSQLVKKPPADDSMTGEEEWEWRIDVPNVNIDKEDKSRTFDKTTWDYTFFLQTPDSSVRDEAGNRPIQPGFTPVRKVATEIPTHNSAPIDFLRTIMTLSIRTDLDFFQILKSYSSVHCWQSLESLRWTDVWYTAEYGFEKRVLRHIFVTDDRDNGQYGYYGTADGVKEVDVGTRIWHRLIEECEMKKGMAPPELVCNKDGEVEAIYKNVKGHYLWREIVPPDSRYAREAYILKKHWEDTREQRERSEAEQREAARLGALPVPYRTCEETVSQYLIMAQLAGDDTYKNHKAMEEQADNTYYITLQDNWDTVRTRRKELPIWKFLKTINKFGNCATACLPQRVREEALIGFLTIEIPEVDLGHQWELGFCAKSYQYPHRNPDTSGSTYAIKPLFRGSSRISPYPPSNPTGNWPEDTVEPMFVDRNRMRERGSENSHSPLAHHYGDQPARDPNTGARRMLNDLPPLNPNLKVGQMLIWGNCGRDAVYPLRIGKTDIFQYYRLDPTRRMTYARRHQTQSALMVIAELKMMKGSYPIITRMEKQHADVFLLMRKQSLAVLPPFYDYVKWGGDIHEVVDFLSRSGYMDTSATKLYGLKIFTMRVRKDPVFLRPDPETTKAVDHRTKEAKVVGEVMPITDCRGPERLGDKLGRRTVGPDVADLENMENIPIGIGIYNITGPAFTVLIPTTCYRWPKNEAHDTTRQGIKEFFDDVNNGFVCNGPEYKMPCL